MIITGLTGGIGSGKSTISRIFHHLGIPVFNSDTEAKKAYLDTRVKQSVIQLLGGDSYQRDQAHFAYIASRVFSDAGLLAQLNQIIHPFVEELFINWTASLADAPYVIKESAILFETGLFRKMNHTICVFAPEELRIQRIQKRDSLAREVVEQRMKQQWPDSQKTALADFLIHNDGKQLILPQILSIHQSLIHSN